MNCQNLKEKSMHLEMAGSFGCYDNGCSFDQKTTQNKYAVKHLTLPAMVAAELSLGAKKLVLSRFSSQSRTK